LLVPEVVQTSAMDCGPAALKALVAGFGIPVSYGRLREACQTDLDGTSIDTLEAVAVQLGLDAEQVMIPADHVLLDEAQALPAIVVVRLANNVTHFVVVWRRHGALVQLMDPADGRRWASQASLREQLYIHSLPVPAAAWREWAGSEDFLRPLRARLHAIGLGADAPALLDGALIDPEWGGLATLDAALRSTSALVTAGALRPGRQACAALGALIEQARAAPDGAASLIPESHWTVRPATPDEDGEAQLLLRGAVLVRARGRRAASPASDSDLPPDLAAAVRERPTQPWRLLLRLLGQHTWRDTLLLSGAVLSAAAAVTLEALLFQALLNLAPALDLVGQRLTALAALIGFVLAVLLLEGGLVAGSFRLGRQIETRLRLAFIAKIPLLGDRYFHSRLISDMAERSHSFHPIRQAPALVGNLLLALAELVLIVVGISWLAPASMPYALLIGVVALLPLAAQPWQLERDLRVRTHVGALSRFYLDALLGAMAIRSHGAERAVRREHDGLLASWARAALGFQRLNILVESAQLLLCYGLVAWLLLAHSTRVEAGGSTLLLIYWAVSLPLLGQEIAALARQLPTYRNLTLRLLEPLAAPADELRADEATPRPAPPGGVGLRFEQVSVVAGGHPILEDIDLELAAGSHVAIVGRSGAGKSSLVGLLLGWHRPVAGQVLLDGEPLDAAALTRLRQHTSWIDPAVQLWNRSLLDNLSYGGPTAALGMLGRDLADAELRELLQCLPEGLQSSLGESGALVSGGEGQRVRFGRALGRRDARLVILDEPFRGLDRQLRHTLLSRARTIWREATLLCITHDVAETRAFSRVLVIDAGRVVEDGAPGELATQHGSLYRRLLDEERAVHEQLWRHPSWRRLYVGGGGVREQQP
jgi:ATP-binding cassette subfamily B protein